MKKILLLLFLITFTTFSSTAQIPRTILGFTIGVTPQEDVLKTMKIKDPRAYTDLEGNVRASTIEYGGITWDNVLVRFDAYYKCKLIYFSLSLFNDERKSLASRLMNSIHQKYQIYNNINNSRRREYSNNDITISVSWGNELYLVYYYDKKIDYNKPIDMNSY